MFLYTGKGRRACDESAGIICESFEAIGIENIENNKWLYAY